MPEAVESDWTLEGLLAESVRRGASDLHLDPGAPPTFRVLKSMVPAELPSLSRGDVEGAVFPHLSEGKWQVLNADQRVHFTLKVDGVGRFRVSVVRSTEGYSATLRTLRSVPQFEETRLPATLLPLLQKRSGLILVTGATGSGKSTSLAAMARRIGDYTPSRKLITLEDPIEYEIPSGKGMVVQREIGQDTPSFREGIKDSLRQDPDVLVVGEMRDKESILACLTAAETGHLVLSTLHTTNAPSTIDRILGEVPREYRNIVTLQLSSSLQAIVTQQLLKTADGKGLALVAEVLMGTETARNCIRDGRPEALFELLQTGAEQGMISRDRSLVRLVEAGLLSVEQVKPLMRSPELIDILVKKGMFAKFKGLFGR